MPIKFYFALVALLYDIWIVLILYYLKPINHGFLFQSSNFSRRKYFAVCNFFRRALRQRHFHNAAIYDEQPFLWEKHWERLTENAKKIGINLYEFSEESVKNSLLEIISKNKIVNARARITFFDESASGIWSFETNKKTSLLITTGDLRTISKICD